MNDEQVYLDNLRHTFNDKAWFMKELPPEVDTIVDFGCADGSFMKWLQRKHNGYRMISVENSESFRKRCEENGIEVYSGMGGINMAPRRIVLVLNSVMHEVCSYSDPDYFWCDVRALRPRCIVVRDMNIRVNHTLYTEETEEQFGKVITSHPDLRKQYDEFREHFHGSYDPYAVVHFLMKYFHRENWPLECAENYNALEIRKFVTDARYSGYDVVYEKHFLLPYFWRRWISDFGTMPSVDRLFSFLSAARTHVKMFLTRTKEADNG